MTRFILTALSIGFLCFASGGCLEKTPEPAAAELKPILSDSVAQATATDVSKEQAEEFAKQLQSTIENGDAAAASKMIMIDRVLDRVALKLDISSRDKAQLREAMRKNNPITTTFQQITTSIPAGGAYKLVRTAVRGDERHVIFRMTDPIQGLNYHDFRLVMDGGKVKADQIFIAASGESFADSLVNIMGPSVRAQQSSLGRLTGAAAQEMKDLDKQAEMVTAARAGKVEEALAIYETMPKNVKESKLVQLSRVMASQAQSEEKYIAAMTEYSNLFPNDPSVALMSFDKAVMNEDVDALKKCFTTLNNWTGGDSYLSLMTAALVAKWGDTQYAKELYENVDAADAGISDGHNFKLTAALFCNDFPVVAKELQVLRDKYGMEVELESDPDFAGFLESPESADFKSN